MDSSVYEEAEREKSVTFWILFTEMGSGNLSLLGIKKAVT